MSTYFRFLNRRGGYTWMQMCAALVCNTKNENEQSILCVNYVLSGSQYGHVIMGQKQVDQPVVRIKRDEDTENQLGSPESRGEERLDKQPRGDSLRKYSGANCLSPQSDGEMFLPTPVQLMIKYCWVGLDLLRL